MTLLARTGDTLRLKDGSGTNIKVLAAIPAGAPVPAGMETQAAYFGFAGAETWPTPMYVLERNGRRVLISHERLKQVLLGEGGLVPS
jgi:hypothetical protein